MDGLILLLATLVLTAPLPDHLRPPTAADLCRFPGPEEVLRQIQAADVWIVFCHDANWGWEEAYRARMAWCYLRAARDPQLVPAYWVRRLRGQLTVEEWRSGRPPRPWMRGEP